MRLLQDVIRANWCLIIDFGGTTYSSLEVAVPAGEVVSEKSFVFVKQRFLKCQNKLRIQYGR